jgi:WD40 repeat protein
MPRVRGLLLACVVLAGSAPAGRAAEPKLELVPQTGHSGEVRRASFSADGKLLLTGSNDGTSILWDAFGGRKLRAFQGKWGLLSPNGRVAATNITATGTWGETILWDAGSGQRLHAVKGAPTAFTPEGRHLLTIDRGDTILWETATGNRLRTFAGIPFRPGEDFFAESWILWAVFSPDGKRLATCGGLPAAPVVMLWDVASGARLATLREGLFYAPGCFSPDARQLLTPYRADQDKPGEIAFWEVATGKKSKSVPVPFAFENAWSPDAGRMLIGKAVHDLTTGKIVRELKGEGGLPLAFSPDGRKIVTGSSEGMTTIWDAERGEVLLHLGSTGVEVVSLAMSADGRLAVSGQRGRTAAILWDLNRGQVTHVLPVHKWGAAVSLSADGRYLLTHEFGETNLWNTSAGTRLRTFTEHYGPVPVGLTADGNKVLANSRFDTKAVFWDIEAKKETPALPAHLAQPLAFSADGRYVIAGSVMPGVSGPPLALWDLTTGKQLKTFACGTYTIPGWAKEIATSTDDFTCVCFSPNGKHILTGHQSNRATLWNVASGQPVHTMTGHAGLVVNPTSASWEGSIRAVAFSPDGKMFATASRDATAILWEAASGQKLKTLAGHTHQLNAIFFTADSKRVVTGSSDGTVRIWDVATGGEVVRLLDFENGKDWLAMTPEGLFDGSTNAPKYLSFRISGTLEFVPLERYQQKYYQPGLLAQIMKGERPQPKVNIQRSLPPVVRFTSPAPSGTEVKTNALEVKVEAESRSGSPIQTLRLLVDARPYKGQYGIHKVQDARALSASASWTIELEPGKHSLKVLADTEYVQGASDEIEVKYVGGGIDPGKIATPTLYVLAIGISDYPGTRKLDYAARDAEAVAEAFQSKSRGLYQQVEVKLLTNDKATEDGIFAGLLWLREKMTGKATGVVFFGGHAEVDKVDNSLYLLPVNFQEKNLAGTAIDAERFRKQLMAIPGRLILMLDACHSGAIGGQGRTRGTGELTDLLVRDLTAEENGLIVMCSALGHEEAQESNEFRHGLFTWALLEALREGKADRTDGAVYLSALDSYVTRRVKELSKGRQNPVTGKPTSVRDFPLSKP